MKSLASGLLHVASGVLEDVRVAYPTYGGVVKDKSRLTRLLEDRGLGLFSLDLPSLDSILTDGLENGRLCLQGSLSRAVSKEVRVPRLFSGLWLRIFYKDGSLRRDVDPTAIFMLRQLCCLGKKISNGCSKKRLRKAFKEYIHVDSQIRPPTLEWALDDFDRSNLVRRIHLRDCVDSSLPLYPERIEDGSRTSSKRVLRLIDSVQRVADTIADSFRTFDSYHQSGGYEGVEFGSIGLRHGPGAVADPNSDKDKYSFPNWPAKLERLFPWSTTGTIASTDPSQRPINHEVSSKLIAVPKTAKGPRLIAAEPTAHQWCQQLMLHFMAEELERPLLKPFINLRDQSISGRMALEASRTGKTATIDLSSASDRLSCWLVERIFRSNPDFLQHLHAVRTRYIRIPSDDKRGEVEYLRLRKFASQGTAVTFPVQSVVFLCIVLGCCLNGNVSRKSILSMKGRVQVFGDDIIVPSAGYADVCEMLDLFGLKVNQEKSFVNGQFRESCGVDAWGGYDVTPCKPQSLTSDGPNGRLSLIDTSNNLFNKGLWHASESVRQLLPSVARRALPICGPQQNPTRDVSHPRRKGVRHVGGLGWASFCGSKVDHLKRRYNPRLHREEFRTWSCDNKTVVRTPRRDMAGTLLQFFTEARVPKGWTLDGPKPIELGVPTKPKIADGLRWEPLYSVLG